MHTCGRECGAGGGGGARGGRWDFGFVFCQNRSHVDGKQVCKGGGGGQGRGGVGAMDKLLCWALAGAAETVSFKALSEGKWRNKDAPSPAKRACKPTKDAASSLLPGVPYSILPALPSLFHNALIWKLVFPLSTTILSAACISFSLLSHFPFFPPTLTSSLFTAH